NLDRLVRTVSLEQSLGPREGRVPVADDAVCLPHVEQRHKHRGDDGGDDRNRDPPPARGRGGRVNAHHRPLRWSSGAETCTGVDERILCSGRPTYLLTVWPPNCLDNTRLA